MTTKGRKPRNGIEYGDVVYVGEGGTRRFGIWTGESFIQYAPHGGDCSVHEISFHDFLSGVAKVGVCRFPAHRNREILAEAVIEALEYRRYPVRLLRLLEIIQQQVTYQLHSPWQTVRRAKASIGRKDYVSGEDFVLWCKTGIYNCREMEVARKVLEKLFERMKEKRYFCRMK